MNLRSVKIEDCEACPRLRRHCLKTAREKRAAFRDETYWAKPIRGFGDRDARLIIVGLAPAAHGANRTGRIFTGDRSGDWLYRALHKAGFANQSTSVSQGDGLRLNDAYITCVVKCAPPDNMPTRIEQARCSERHLEPELRALSRPKVWLALGQIALHGLWRTQPWVTSDARPPTRPAFGHGAEAKLPGDATLLMSYHPSQQNTFTGRLTESMFDSVFVRVRALLREG